MVMGLGWNGFATVLPGVDQLPGQGFTDICFEKSCSEPVMHKCSAFVVITLLHRTSYSNIKERS